MRPTWVCSTFSMFFHIFGGSFECRIPIPMFEYVSDIDVRRG